MPTIHNLYVVVPYTEKLAAEVVPTGYRLAVIRWRETAEVKKSGKVPPAPRAVLVPEIPLDVTAPKLLVDSLRNAIDKLQDDRIRAILNKHLEGEGNLLNISVAAEDINEAGVAAWLAEETTGGRLSGEAIRNWFDTQMLSIVQGKAIAAGKNEREATQIVNGYRATYMKLASPMTPIQPAVLDKLTELLAHSAELGVTAMDEKIANAIIKRTPRSEDDVLMDI